MKAAGTVPQRKYDSARIAAAVNTTVTTALLIAGCTAGPDDLTQRAGGHVLWTPAHEPRFHMEALIEGNLGVTETGCFTILPVPLEIAPEALENLSDEDHELVLEEPEVRPVQFPHGTALSDDGQSVDIPGIGDVALGELVSGGGGEIHTNEEGLKDVAPECVAGTVLIFSSAS